MQTPASHIKEGGVLMLRSPAFTNGGRIPQKYTIDGQKASPPLKWDDPPGGTKSFAILMEDLDVPKEYGGIFIHWMVHDIPASARELSDGARPDGKLPDGAREVPNFYARMGMANTPMVKYGPPWPPTPDHRYKFTLFALKVEKLQLGRDAGYEEFMKEVKKNMLSTSELIGVYGPSRTPLPK